ncbi:MFS transporter [Achromobacter denitrificans]|uniref:MFS transporter n=1 Tax=Achromobacter denitrificans TaxID=32002 RepID=A0A6N0JV44_ACHDE|nr:MULTISPECIES: MFS transporter [Burkholderiales]MDF3940102.1 MFS transporter [Achromobacter denitrificans]QKQ50907.1 MFS transporter [Achromobacter denitrificans]GAD23408.1 permeases of the major facilitator superfamily [Acidovorax sp. MR-S7]
MIPPRAIVCLGLTQLVGWGVTFYLIGALGPAMAADLGWNAATVYGGFSAAIVVMAMVSPLAGLAVDRWGGHRVMPAGAVVAALGCALLAAAHGLALYYLAWIALGIGMRLCLYDAAFASLARAAGPTARRPMSQITLFGGLASTVMWPVGHALAGWLGWRGAVLAYGALALSTLPLYLALPRERYAAPAGAKDKAATGLARSLGERRLAGALYALIAMLTNFLAAGNAAHLISLLSGLGLAAAAAVSVAALWGVGQFAARLADVALGSRLHPLTLTLAVGTVLPLCFLLALLSGGNLYATAAYALLYGACNGLLTITRGTLPLALFDFRSYGTLVGALLIPSFLLTATAPVAYAYLVESHGARGAMAVSVGLAAAIFAAALALRWTFIGRVRAATA